MFNIETMISGVNQGLLWALLAIGVYLTFRLLDFPDLTVEGSFALGGAVVAKMVGIGGMDPFVATIVAFLIGALAGLVTGILHTQFKIPAILAGILTMIGLYSINIRIMGSPNQSTGSETIIQFVSNWLHLPRMYAVLVIGLVLVAVAVGGLYWFFGTETGSAIRATGTNAKMCRAQGINTKVQTVMCLMLSNALIALSGALVTQEQSFGDVTMGVGAIVVGLASIIIGETLFAKARNFFLKLTSVVVGSVIYRVIITWIISSGNMTPSDVKLMTAILITVALSLPLVKQACIRLSKWIATRNATYAAWLQRRADKRAQRAEAAKQKALALAEKAQNTAPDAKTEAQMQRDMERLIAKRQARETMARLRRRAKTERQSVACMRRATAVYQQAKAVADRIDAIAKAAGETPDAKTQKTLAKLRSRLVELNRIHNELRAKSVVLNKYLTDGKDILQISNLSKTFNPGTNNEKKALNDLSLTVRQGDFITVIGGNGAGKSTLLNMISGVYNADKGDVYLDGANITKMSEHRRAKYLGRVFQDPMLGTAANMEIQENLALAYRRGKLHTLRWAIAKAEKSLYYAQLKRLGLGLESRMTARVGLLSGGQRQALTLLMSTLVEPKLLLLDEHTAALDPKTAAQVLQLTEEITSERNITTIMITHNMKDAIRYGNRLIMMHEGRVIYDVRGEEKSRLHVEDLLRKFEEVSGTQLANDRMLMN